MLTKPSPSQAASTAVQRPPAPPSTAIQLLPDPTLPPITRPLSTVGGHTYAAIWPYVPPENSTQPPSRALIFVRDDGQLLENPAQPNPTGPPAPYADPALPAAVSLLPAHCLWSAAGLQRFIAGHRPDPAEVFQRLVAVLNHFVDFTGSLAWPAWSHNAFLPQPDPTVQPAAELLAAYVLSTWFTPALPPQGILWITGDLGSGKSRLLSVLARLSHLGVAFPGLPSSTPLLRLAGLGAALAVDNALFLGPGRQGATSAVVARRSIFLAGSQRGAYWPAPHPGQISGRLVDVTGPRLVATTADPDPSLAGVCLVIPLVRTADITRSNLDPADPAAWPPGIDPVTLTDDLWALSLSRLPQLAPRLAFVAAQAAAHDPRLSSNTNQPLQGAALQPWHALLAVASWLSQQTRLPPDPDAPVLDFFDRSPENYHAVVAHTTARARGTPGLFDRLLVLARHYHLSQRILGRADLTNLALRALFVLVEAAIRTARAEQEAADALSARLDHVFKTRGLAAMQRVYNAAAAGLDLTDADLDAEAKAAEDENDDKNDEDKAGEDDQADADTEPDGGYGGFESGKPKLAIGDLDVEKASKDPEWWWKRYAYGGYGGYGGFNQVGQTIPTAELNGAAAPAVPAVPPTPPAVLSPPNPDPRSEPTARAGDDPARHHDTRSEAERYEPLPPLIRPIYTFSSIKVAEVMCVLVKEYTTFISPEEINVTLVGRLLRQLGLTYRKTTQTRLWSLRPADLLRLSHAYSEPMHPTLAHNLATYQPSAAEPVP